MRTSSRGKKQMAKPSVCLNVGIKSKIKKIPLNILCDRMLVAIKKKDEVEAQNILKNGFDANTMIFQNQAAIDICVANGVCNIAELLLGRSCPLKSSRAFPLLQMAVKNGDVPMADLLLSQGSQGVRILSHFDSSGKTPLHTALSIGDSAMVEMLISKCTVSMLCMNDSNGRSPIHFAIMAGNVELVQLLLTRRGTGVAQKILSCVDSRTRTPLHLACREKNIDIVKVLLSKAALEHLRLKDADKLTPLTFAFRYSTKKIIDLLVEFSEYNSDDPYGNLLTDALDNPNVSLGQVKKFIEARGNVNGTSYRTSPLLAAISRLQAYMKNPVNVPYWCRLHKISFLLINSGGDIKDHNEALHAAIKMNNLRLVEAILNCNCNPNAEDYQHHATPLFNACVIGNKKVINVLLSAGATMIHQRSLYMTTNTQSQIDYAKGVLKEWKPLSYLCRNVIRKHLKNINEDVYNLPALPPTLQSYVLNLEE